MEYWDREAAWSGDVLERIVAMLFALANLADLAAGASFLRRRQVLVILSHGEAEAPEGAGDAARLAVRLRALALVLCVLLAQAGQFALPCVVDLQAGRPVHEISGCAVRWLGVQPPFAADTS